MPVRARSLQDCREFLQSRIRQEPSEPFSHQTRSEVGMAIAIRAQRGVSVVHVKGPEPVAADAPIDLVEERAHGLWIRDVDTRHP